MVLTSSVVFAGSQDFTLVNHTGHAIVQVYVSPSRSNDWQEDVLGDDTLGNGTSVHITFSRNSRPSHWDVKVVFADGSSKSWSHFNLREITTITLKRDGHAAYE
jgi:hypothetical protein